MSTKAPSPTRALPSFFDDDALGLPDRLFDLRWPALFNDRFFRTTALPAVNVKETAIGHELELAVPGYHKEDLQVSVDDGVLTIRAEHEREHEAVRRNYTRHEFHTSSFSRSFTLPGGTDAEGVKAKYEHGVLHITIPRAQGAATAPGKEIRIG